VHVDERSWGEALPAVAEVAAPAAESEAGVPVGAHFVVVEWAAVVFDGEAVGAPHGVGLVGDVLGDGDFVELGDGGLEGGELGVDVAEGLLRQGDEGGVAVVVEGACFGGGFDGGEVDGFAVAFVAGGVDDVA
jgi:hypothetical protein